MGKRSFTCSSSHPPWWASRTALLTKAVPGPVLSRRTDETARNGGQESQGLLRQLLARITIDGEHGSVAFTVTSEGIAALANRTYL